MPIRREMKALYPKDWRAISLRIRTERARGRCEWCGRPDRAAVRVVWDGTGRWAPGRGSVVPGEGGGYWRGRTGEYAEEPSPALRIRVTWSMLTVAHLDHDPTNSADENLRALCQSCHLHHDRLHHLETARREFYRELERAGQRRLPFPVLDAE